MVGRPTRPEDPVSLEAEIWDGASPRPSPARSGGYLDLMYHADDRQFLKVFLGECIIHGMRDGKLAMWPASEFRDIMRSRPSPAAMKSPRDQDILSIACTGPDLAIANVRVRIGQICFQMIISPFIASTGRGSLRRRHSMSRRCLRRDRSHRQLDARVCAISASSGAPGSAANNSASRRASSAIRSR